MCGCIVGWQSVVYQVLGHCDLDLFSRIIVSGVYRLYYSRLESQIWCVDSSWDDGVMHTILGIVKGHFGVWMHLWMVICRGPFKVTVTNL